MKRDRKECLTLFLMTFTIYREKIYKKYNTRKIIKQHGTDNKLQLERRGKVQRSSKTRRRLMRRSDAAHLRRMGSI